MSHAPISAEGTVALPVAYVKNNNVILLMFLSSHPVSNPIPITFKIHPQANHI
jgi:hypothetical protein